MLYAKPSRGIPLSRRLERLTKGGVSSYHLPSLREPAIVLGPVKDASRRKRGGLRPSLTCPARAGLLSAGRDEGTGACSQTKEHFWLRVVVISLCRILSAG